MNEVKQLIEKFWSKTISPQEEVRLLDLISREPHHLEQDLLAEYEQELVEIKREITEKRFQDILEQLHVRIENKETPKTVKLYAYLKWVAAILILTAGIFLFNNKHADVSKLASDVKAPTERSLRLHEQQNIGNKPQSLRLPDGSRVTLYPGSAVAYYEPFVNKSREISMNGKASFEVAKDKAHPFIVTSKGFTTTALGTSFTVNAQNSNQVLVKLIEGKVVIKATPTSGMQMEDIYLIPGQQLSINTKLKTQLVSNFKLEKHSADVSRPGQIPSTSMLSFKETKLDDVFARLAERYHVEISYEGIDSLEVGKLYFTGTFDGSETLDVILPAICNMNDLNFRLTYNKFIISKLK